MTVAGPHSWCQHLQPVVSARKVHMGTETRCGSIWKMLAGAISTSSDTVYLISQVHTYPSGGHEMQPGDVQRPCGITAGLELWCRDSLPQDPERSR